MIVKHFFFGKRGAGGAMEGHYSSMLIFLFRSSNLSFLVHFKYLGIILSSDRKDYESIIKILFTMVQLRLLVGQL